MLIKKPERWLVRNDLCHLLWLVRCRVLHHMTRSTLKASSVDWVIWDQIAIIFGHAIGGKIVLKLAWLAGWMEKVGEAKFNYGIWLHRKKERSKRRIINGFLLLPFLSLPRRLDMPLMDGKPQPVFEVSRRVFFLCSNDLELDCGLSGRAEERRKKHEEKINIYIEAKANCCWWVKLILAYSSVFASEHYAKSSRRGGDDEDENCFTLSSELICHVNFENCSLSFKRVSPREMRSLKGSKGDTRWNNSRLIKHRKAFLAFDLCADIHASLTWPIAWAR